MTAGGAPDVSVVVLSTVPDAASAERLARIMIEERLAASVTRVPGARSLSRRRGTVQETEEVLMMAKTHAGRAPELTRRLAELHPDELPEILVLPVAAGLRGYLDWIRESTVPGGER